MDEIVVVAILRTEDGCFKEAPVTKAVDAAKFIDKLTMHLENFADGQVAVARREILFRGHRVYLARR